MGCTVKTNFKFANDKEGLIPDLLSSRQISISFSRGDTRTRIREAKSLGFTHGTTFRTHDRILVPDKIKWSSGNGRRIEDNLFLFPAEITEDLFESVRFGRTDLSAYYLGLESTLTNFKIISTEVVYCHFQSKQLTAWLKLFLDRNREDQYTNSNPMDFINMYQPKIYRTNDDS